MPADRFCVVNQAIQFGQRLLCQADLIDINFKTECSRFVADVKLLSERR